jgi:hypothetical protein
MKDNSPDPFPMFVEEFGTAPSTAACATSQNRPRRVAQRQVLQQARLRTEAAVQHLSAPGTPST